MSIENLTKESDFDIIFIYLFLYLHDRRSVFMKRILLCISIFILQACSVNNDHSMVYSNTVLYKPEQGAKLIVYVSDLSVGEFLIELWNQTYEEYTGMISITTDIKKSDVYWTSDNEVMKSNENGYIIKNLSVDNPCPDVFIKKEIENMFYPIYGNGMVFVWNKETAKHYGIHDEVLKDFKQLKDIEQGYYFHRNLDSIAPFFLYKRDQNVAISMNDLFKDDFLNRYIQYRNFYNDLNIQDNTLDDKVFYEDNGYISGLVSMKDIKKTTSYENMHLAFIPMPSYDGKQLHTILDTYGFVIKPDCKYPEAALAFLQMLRSDQGIKKSIDNGLYPLLSKEDIEEIGIYDSYVKQILLAMHDSQLRNTSYIKEKSSIQIEELIEDSDFISLLQNSLYEEENHKIFLQKVRKSVVHWIYTQ